MLFRSPCSKPAVDLLNKAHPPTPLLRTRRPQRFLRATQHPRLPRPPACRRHHCVSYCGLQPAATQCHRKSPDRNALEGSGRDRHSPSFHKCPVSPTVDALESSFGSRGEPRCLSSRLQLAFQSSPVRCFPPPIDNAASDGHAHAQCFGRFITTLHLASCRRTSSCVSLLYPPQSHPTLLKSLGASRCLSC